MSADENRRPLYKRFPILNKVAPPRPYTSLTQPKSERMRLKSGSVNLSSLEPQGAPESSLSARLVSEGLSDLANQVTSSEYQARLAQNAAEATLASETSAQLEKALDDLRKSELSSLDKRITEELERQGITKTALQRNPRLRASVNKWKREIYAGINKGLDVTEAESVKETQAVLSGVQQAGRGELRKNIEAYEAEIAPSVEEAITSSKQQKVTEGLVKRGVVTVDADKVSLRKSVADLTAKEIADLNSLGFNVTQKDVDVASAYNKQQQLISNLVSQGLITTKDNVVTLNRSLASLSSDDLAQLNSLGFNLSEKDVQEAQMYLSGSQIPRLPKLSQQQVYTATGTTKFSPAQIAAQNEKFKEALALGKITPEEYNQAIAQQNANLNAVTLQQQTTVDSLIKSGTLKKTVEGRAGGLKTAYAITKPLASISDSELNKLEQIGFNISPEMRTQRVETQNLIADKVVKLENNQVKLLKPISALSDTEIGHLKNIGFSVPEIPKGPSQYIYDYAKSQGYQPGTALKPDPFGAARNENLRNLSAVVGDVFQTITLPLLPYQLAMSLVPGEQPLESGFRGPTSSSLSYYEDVSPARQAGLTALGALSSYSVGALASVPVGFAAKVVPSVAKQFTANVAKTMSTSALATSIKSIAVNLKMGGNAVIKALPLESASAAQLTKAMTVLMKNPKFQQAVLWSTMAGMNVADVYGQLARGEPVDKVIERSAVSLSGQLGAYQGFMKGYGYVKNVDWKVPGEAGWKKISSNMKIEPFYGKDGSVYYYGKVNTLKGLPQEVLKTFEQGNMITKADLIKSGMSTDIAKATFTQDFHKLVAQRQAIEMESSNFIDTAITRIAGKKGYAILMEKGYNFSTMQPREILAAISDNLGKNAVKNYVKALNELVEAKYLGTARGLDGSKELMVNLIGKDDYYRLLREGVDLSRMTPDQQLTVLYADLGYNTPWEAVVKKLNDGMINSIKTTSTGKVIVPSEISRLSSELSKLGLKSADSTRLISDILFDQLKYEIGDKKANKLISIVLRAHLGNEGITGQQANRLIADALKNRGNISLSINELSKRGVSRERILNLLGNKQNVDLLLTGTNYGIPPPHIGELFKELHTLGLSDEVAAKLTSELLTLKPKETVNLVNSLFKNEKLAEDILVLSLKYNPTGDSLVTESLVKTGLTQQEVSDVIKITALKEADPQLMLQELAETDVRVARQIMPYMDQEVMLKELEAITKNHERMDKFSSLMAKTFNSEKNPLMIAKIASMLPTEALKQTLTKLSLVTMKKVVPNISARSLATAILFMDTAALTNTFTSATDDQLKIIIPSISPHNFASIIERLNTDALSMIVPNLSTAQIIDIANGLSTSQLTSFMTSLSNDQIRDILAQPELQTKTLTEYLKTIRVPTPTIEEIPPPPKPPFIKGKFDIKKGTKIDSETKIRVFDVYLKYPNSSTCYKIKSNSFHGAAREALIRSQSKQVPVNVVVKPVYEQ